MTEVDANRAEIVRKGQALYEEQIRDRVEGKNRGKFLALNVDTGDYEIDAEELAALHRVRARNPGGELYLIRIGYPAAYRLGGTDQAARS